MCATVVACVFQVVWFAPTSLDFLDYEALSPIGSLRRLADFCAIGERGAVELILKLRDGAWDLGVKLRPGSEHVPLCTATCEFLEALRG